jgi:hypothetical protein
MYSEIKTQRTKSEASNKPRAERKFNEIILQTNGQRCGYQETEYKELEVQKATEESKSKRNKKDRDSGNTRRA